jgi:large subunit ribosomal protein L7/L12
MFASRFLRSALPRASTRLLSSEAAPENVKLIVDEICKLNLMEVKHLNQLLRVSFTSAQDVLLMYLVN